MTIGDGIFGDRTTDQRVADARAAALDQLVAQGYEQLRNVREIPGTIYSADGRDLLWLVQYGTPGDGPQPGTDAFVPLSDGTAAWYQRPPEDRPQTLGELRDWQDANAVRSAAEAAATLATARSRAVPVTLADANPGAPVSLRAALELLEPQGGGATIRKGQLVVSVPLEVVNGINGVSVRAAVRTLYAGEALVVAAVRGDGPVPAAKVPDGPLLPNGRLAP